MNILRDTNFRVILAVIAMGIMGGSLVGPILPVMIDPLSISEALVGWVLSIYTLFAMVFTPVLGVVADRVGRKKVMIPATLLFGVAGLSISLTTTFWIVLLLRAIQGTCVAGMLSIGVTLIGDLYPSGETRNKAMGYRVSVQNFVNALVPFTAGAIAIFAWFYPFLIYALAIPISILLIFKLKIKEERADTALKDYLKAASTILSSSRTIWVFFSNLMAFIFLYCIIVYMPLIITNKLNLSTIFSGLAISIGSASAGIFASQTPRLRGVLKDHTMVLTGFTLAGLSLLFIGMSPSIVYILLSMTIWGAGFSFIMPTITTIATEQAPVQLRAGVIAVFTMMIYLGQTVSPPLFGEILKISDLATVFIVASLANLLPIGFTLWQMRKG